MYVYLKHQNRKFTPYEFTIEVSTLEDHDILRSMIARNVTIPLDIFPHDEESQVKLTNMMQDIHTIMLKGSNV